MTVSHQPSNRTPLASGPNPGTPDVARAEAALAIAEQDLHRAHQEMAARLKRVEDFRLELRARLEAGREAGMVDAASILGRLPAPVMVHEVPQQVAALDARLLAVQAREAAVAATREMLSSSEKQALKAWAQLQDLQVASLALKRPEPVVPDAPVPTQAAAAPTVQLRPPRPKAAPPAPQHAENKRQAPRARIHCEVDMETESNFFTGFGWDISSGGLFVASFDPMPVGSDVDIAFSLPDGTRVEATAVVRWQRDEDRSGAHALPGVGLQFTRIAPEAEAAIQRFLTAREPMFYTT